MHFYGQLNFSELSVTAVAWNALGWKKTGSLTRKHTYSTSVEYRNNSLVALHSKKIRVTQPFSLSQKVVFQEQDWCSSITQ